MAQYDRVLEHLKTKGALQPMSAWRDLGVYRLAARINDLRNAGHKISTKKVEVVNRWGESTFIAQYELEAKGV